MAEPLKNSFGPDVPGRLADMIGGIEPEFDKAGFIEQCLENYESLELTGRARHIAAALAVHLPSDRLRALEIIVGSLGPEIEEAELTGMGGFVYLPFVFFVADHGIEHFEESMTAQYELTKRFTAEFSIRAFLDRYPDATLARLREWAVDPDVHVRRLVSEGSRPRLPWAPRLRAFQADPQPVIELLELLKDDPEEYVRRSVANNLNDIAKDHPDVVVEIARRWWDGASSDRRRLIRHGLRSLIKQGHPDALDVLGYGADSPVRVTAVGVTPEVVAIGGSVRVEIDLENPSPAEAGALVDVIVHFVKANGSTSPKVFKGAEVSLSPGERTTVSKSVSVRQHSTRTHHPGRHEVEVQLNGRVVPGAGFDLTP
ncbi:MAG: DNA alkylation repair protein [Acidimicrobiia bacterium]|nr:DNA alkylation repair protein [Acidimicrobiia bacterium]